MEKILSKKLPMDIILKIKNLKSNNRPKYICYFCKEPVTYNDYVDGAGYICYGCIPDIY